jgi:hypothetical protein
MLETCSTKNGLVNTTISTTLATTFRMDRNRIPEQALEYKLKERRNTGSPKKRCRDQLPLEG